MPRFRRHGGKGAAGGSLRIYYASDIHGTEVLWRKFLHAPAVYDAPVIIMGGDVTGKVVIPLVDEGAGIVSAELFGQSERTVTPGTPRVRPVPSWHCRQLSVWRRKRGARSASWATV